LPEGYARLSEKRYAELGFQSRDFDDARTGYSAKVYINEDSNRVVVANRGTEGLIAGSDTDDNLLHPFIGETGQYRAARELARKVAKTMGDEYTVEFTGHSLGGNLAAYQALTTGLHAISFNAAGLSNVTRRELASNAVVASNAGYEDHRITAYYINGEILSSTQDSWVVDAAVGMVVNSMAVKVVEVLLKSTGLELPEDDIEGAPGSTGLFYVEDHLPAAAGVRHKLTAVSPNSALPGSVDNESIHEISKILQDVSVRVFDAPGPLELHGIAAVRLSIDHDLNELKENLERLNE